MRIITTIILGFIHFVTAGQTLGGNAAYNFLKLPPSPLLTAAGSVNVSYRTDDAGLAVNNPALLQPALHSMAGVAFNGFPAGINTYSLTGAYHHQSLETTFGGQLYFLDYGAVPQTDPAGNESGQFRPVDFVIQMAAARQYLLKWNYGASVKLIHSRYGQYRSTVLALDVGLHYADSVSGIDAGFTAKNMGAQIKKYGTEGEDLPFDLQIGVTKKLANAPFAFSANAQQLHRFNILYNDTSFNNENRFDERGGFFNKLLNHFVIASHIYIGDHIEATVGYNHLRRSELNLAESANGLNGFSMGVRVRFSGLQFMYARSQYQSNLAYNQVGLNLKLNQLVGLGKDL